MQAVNKNPKSHHTNKAETGQNLFVLLFAVEATHKTMDEYVFEKCGCPCIQFCQGDCKVDDLKLLVY